MTKFISMLLAAAMMTILTACAARGDSDGVTGAAGGQPVYTDYRDVPGITQEEIDAIEQLKSHADGFVYGTLFSTESFIGTDGEVRGFTGLFCKWLTDLFDIPFTPEFFEWNELIDGLDNGSVDFTGELTATQERRETYFMTDAIAGRSVRYMRLAGSAPLVHLSVSRPLRFVFLEGTTTLDEVAAYYPDEYESFIVGSYEEAHKLLTDGTVDAFVDEDTGEAAFDIYGNVISEPFYPLIHGPVSLATRTDANEPIVAVVQKAIEHEHIRRFLADIYNVGQSEYSRHKLFMSFTDEELGFIQSNPVINFAAEFDNYPVSFYNRRYDNWQGIFFDVIREVSDLTGLTFTQVHSSHEDFSTLLRMLDSGEVDFISEVIQTPEREGNYLWPDTPLLIDNYALLSKEEYPNITISEVWHTNVAIVEDTAHAEVFNQWFPNHLSATTVANFDVAFEALQRDEVDMVMASRNQLLVLTNYQELVGYKANIVFDYPLVSFIGISTDNEILREIFNKAIRLVDTDRIERFWIDRTYDYTVKLMEARLPWLIGTIVMLLFFMLMLLISLQSRRREQLLAVEKTMLTELNRKKTEFLQDMKHEIRAPLTVIASGIDVTDHIISKDPLDTEKASSTLEIVREETQRLGRMIGAMLTVASMSEVSENRKRIDITSVLTSACDMFQTTLSGNTLDLDIAPGLPDVFVEHDRIKQVITNLLSNAAGHTKNGHIKVTCGQSGQFIKVTVADTGCGIPEELLPHIFERGTSGRDSTGYGLYICKAIVEAHGGTITAESTPGCGTTMTFTIPAYAGQDAGHDSIEN